MDSRLIPLAIGAALAKKDFLEAVLTLPRSLFPAQWLRLIDSIRGGRETAAKSLGLTLSNGETLIECVLRTLAVEGERSEVKKLAVELIAARALMTPEQLAGWMEQRVKGLRDEA